MFEKKGDVDSMLFMLFDALVVNGKLLIEKNYTKRLGVRISDIGSPRTCNDALYGLV